MIKNILDNAPQNLIIFDSLLITNNKLKRYNNIMCSISGGADSDILLDICTKLDVNKKIKYVFFDTGLEYVATKNHLQYLEKKYNITIEVEKAIKPISLCCRQYGVPFLSKQISEWIKRLQKHNFKWEDKPFDVLYEEYPRCKAALKWWCNKFDKKKNGQESSYNINYHKYLKEFLIANPPQFKISNECCTYAKKNVGKKYKENNHIDLSIIGVRKAEGGARATAYKTCFSANDDKADEYRALFWYKKSDREEYETHYDICHSDCYTKYGLDRTGCAGCPYGGNFEKELEIIHKHEPKLYKAANKIFGESYEYTRKYREFILKMESDLS